jgi:hypothetical protein
MEDFDLIIAINLPKLPTTPEMLDDVQNIDNNNLNLVNLFQSDTSTNANYGILDTLGEYELQYNSTLFRRYVNIHYDHDAPEGTELFRIVKLKNTENLQEIINEIKDHIGSIDTYEQLIDFLTQMGNPKQLKILVVDLVENTLSESAEDIREEIQEQFEAPGLRDVAFFGGKRKSKQKSKQKSKRKKRSKKLNKK